jgi:hypothetical protein
MLKCIKLYTYMLSVIRNYCLNCEKRIKETFYIYRLEPMALLLLIAYNPT